MRARGAQRATQRCHCCWPLRRLPARTAPSDTSKPSLIKGMRLAKAQPRRLNSPTSRPRSQYEFLPEPLTTAIASIQATRVVTSQELRSRLITSEQPLGAYLLRVARRTTHRRPHELRRLANQRQERPSAHRRVSQTPTRCRIGARRIAKANARRPNTNEHDINASAEVQARCRPPHVSPASVRGSSEEAPRTSSPNDPNAWANQPPQTNAPPMLGTAGTGGARAPTPHTPLHAIGLR